MAKAEGVPLNEWAKVNDDVFDKLCKRYKVADKDLKDFLKTWDGSGDIQEAFTAHMKESTEGLTLFQRAGKAVGITLKELGATLGSMAAMWAIGEVISLIVTAIDKFTLTAEEAKDAANDFSSSYNDLKSELSSNSTKIADLKRCF